MSNLQLRIISAVVLIAAVARASPVSAALPSACSSRPSPARSSTNGAHVADRRPAGAISWSPAVASWRGAARASCSVFRSLASLFCLRCRCSPLRSTARLGGQGLWTPAGLAYAGLSGLSLAMLRDGDHAGLIAILFLFAVVWATDIFAYFVGRSLGGPKLAPRFRPARRRAARSAARSAAWSPASRFGHCAGPAICRCSRWSRCCCRSCRRPATCSNPGSSGATASRIRAGSFPAMAASWTASTGLSRRPLPYTSSAGSRQRRQARARSVCDLSDRAAMPRICRYWRHWYLASTLAARLRCGQRRLRA